MNCCCCRSQALNEMIKDVYQCKSCEHIYCDYKGDIVDYHVNMYRALTGPRRDKEEIDASGQVTELFHTKREDMVAKRMSFIENILTEDYECLDIGAGAGTFAKSLAKRVKTVECTELSANLLEECKRLGFKTYDEDILTLELEKKYDIVFAWHVLEHLEDIHAFVDKVRNLTKRYVVIEVPLLTALNGQGRRRRLKEPNLGNFDGHAHYFSHRSFRLLFEEQFEILEIKEGVQSPALFALMEVKDG
tara:strand:+ start:383 stop:1123 length:741 start_codon:yes stop_codon:yes gene_type:complete